MFKFAKTAVLSAMLGLGGIAAVPAEGQAQGLYLDFGNGGYPGPRGGIYFGDSGRGWERPHRHWDRRCTPERALRKAERLGVRRARVVDVDRRTISVRGRQYGERVWLTFARAPHCPVIG